MKNVVLLTLSLLAANLPSYCQQVNCAITVQQHESECSVVANCNSTEGCATQPFHLNCSGDYTLVATAACGSTNCGHCAACVNVYTDPPGGIPVASCNTLSICEQNDCESACQVNLSSGDYIMYVCLTSCTDAEGDIFACCEEDETCKARGCLRWGIATSCP